MVFTLIFGVFLDGFSTVLNWASGGSTIADFTGLEQFVKFSPFIVWILGIGAGAWLAILGIQDLRQSKGKSGGGGGGGGMH
jgi:hypothetical protein